MSSLVSMMLNPFVLVPLIIIFMFLGIVIMVSLTGKPAFARKWPIANRIYNIAVRVHSARNNGYKKIDTAGRRIEKPDGTQIFETIKFKDMIPFELSKFGSGSGGDYIELVQEESGEFHPLVIEKREENEYVTIVERDKDGKPLLNEDGTQKTKQISIYRHRPITQTQRMFIARRVADAPIKYAKKQSILSMLLPYLGIILCGAFIVIIIGMYLQQGADYMKYAAEISKYLPQVDGIYPRAGFLKLLPD